MIVLPNMGLVKWDSINDYFSHVQLAANFSALDEHDHTAGKGKPVAYGGLAPLSVGIENLREGVIYPTSQVYRVLAEQTQGWDSDSAVSGKWFGGKLPNTSDWSETTFPPNNGFCYITPSEYEVSGKTTKYNLRTVLITNGTAPGMNFISGLHKIESSSGGSKALNVGIAASPVTGSTATFTTPSTSTIYDGATSGAVVTTKSEDFTISLSGLYGIGVQLTNTFAVGAAALAISTLRIHHT